MLKAKVAIDGMQISFKYFIHSLFSTINKLLIKFVLNLFLAKFLIKRIAGACSLKLKYLNPIFNNREILFLYLKITIIAPYICFFPSIGTF